MIDILVQAKSDQNLDDFIINLIEQIKTYFIEHLDDTQINRLNNFLFTNNSIIRPIYASPKAKRVSARDILVGACQNLTYSKSGGTLYRIFINPNIRVPGTYNSFESLLQLIDKGNLMLSPYTIWSDTVTYFCNNIPALYAQYEEEKSIVNKTI